jgi:hypothetical protein
MNSKQTPSFKKVALLKTKLIFPTGILMKD